MKQGTQGAVLVDTPGGAFSAQRPSLCKRLFSGQSSFRHALPKGHSNARFAVKAAAGLALLEEVPVAAAGTAAPADDVPSSQQTNHEASRASLQRLPSKYLGFAVDIDAEYELGKELGSGGYGTVRLCNQKTTGREFACKSVRKDVGGDATEAKVAAHLKAIQNEVEVLTILKGSLNVVQLQDVFEDDTHVHIVMQYCQGGELHHRIGTRHYTERSVASYMRAVLRTLAQCHSHHILHRDIKPGNFMLLDDSDESPLMAIDFGLAIRYNPEALPLTNLGLEGTPWFMSPEVLNSKVGPASDIWSAGVMAHQLLTGRMPFDDKRNPFSPGLSAIWRSTLNDNLEFHKPYWSGISTEAKDFVMRLLERDPTKRLTAKEALNHPWLQTESRRSARAKPLGRAVVQRIQRFAQGSLLKQHVLQDMADQLIKNAALQQEDCNDDLAAVHDKPEHHSAPNNVQELLQGLHVLDEKVGMDVLQQSLSDAGARMHPRDLDRLASFVDLDADGQVERSTLAASLMDWRTVQAANLHTFLDAAHNTFTALDKDGDGLVTRTDIEERLRFQLPPSQMDAAVRSAFVDARASDESHGLDFNAFLNMLRIGSVDSLDQYDDRASFGSRSLQSIASYASLRSMAASNNSLHSMDDNSSHRVGSYVKAIMDDELHLPNTPGSKRVGAGGIDQARLNKGLAGAAAQPAKVVFRFDDHGAGAKAPPPQRMVFRFDDHGMEQHKQHKQAVPAGAGAHAHAAGRGGHAEADVEAKLPVAATSFRFTDHSGTAGGLSQQFRKIKAAAAAAAANGGGAFRFDDHGVHHGGLDVVDEETDDVVASVAGMGASRDGSFGRGKDGSGSGGRSARSRGSNACSRGALYSKPGFQEKRMHGSNLYRNAAMLRAVQE